jgi:6-phosphogluconolactonase
MKVEVFPDSATVAASGADFIFEEAAAAISARGVFTMALSGGKTPWLMTKALAALSIPWEHVQLFQIDERVAPAGDADRNLTHLRETLLEHTALKPENVHPMPVENADLEAAAADYSRVLRQFAGTPPVLDLVHLGLGPDGHTASLVPHDPALDVTAADVTVTNPYQGRRRMTLTYPVLNRSRRILWLVTGADKAPMFERLKVGDESIPAGRICRDHSVILADRAAAGMRE